MAFLKPPKSSLANCLWAVREALPHPGTFGALPIASPTVSPIQTLSQPGSPAPGPPAQMDLEHPPQPSFAAPTSLLKKEPPGYEESVSQQPKQQVRMLGAGVC